MPLSEILPGQLVTKAGTTATWRVVHICPSGDVCISCGDYRTFTAASSLRKV